VVDSAEVGVGKSAAEPFLAPVDSLCHTRCLFVDHPRRTSRRRNDCGRTPHPSPTGLRALLHMNSWPQSPHTSTIRC
jgi:hypothetical protein